jgi:xylulokinase
MADLVLTIDAGTSGCKSIIFDLRGHIVSKSQCPYSIDTKLPGRAELDPAELFSALHVSLRSALEGIEADRISGICVSAQLGLGFVDKKGNPLLNLLTWMDKRATDQAARIESVLGDQAVYRYAGRRIDPELPACKLLWLKETVRNLYAKIHKVLSIKDLIVYSLTGEFVTDPIHASYSMMFHVEEQKWHEPFFEAFSMNPELMPTVLSSMSVVGETIGSLIYDIGLPAGIPVYNGGPDGSLAALGSGLIEEGNVVHVVGTTDVVLACSRRTVFDEKKRTLVNCYAVPDRWTLGGPMSTTGGCLKWFFENVASASVKANTSSSESAFGMLMRAAEKVQPGAENLFVIPSLVGERTPFWNQNVRGVIFGLTLNHQKKHIIRAILEGSAYSAKYLMQILEKSGLTIERIHMVGGGAQSRLWAGIRADVSGKPVVVPKVTDATCLGSALLAYMGIDVYSTLEEAVRVCIDASQTVEPNHSRNREYERRFEVYIALRSDLEDSFERLSLL